ncbi:MIF4G like-domain-containing protein [Vararia minispora EC-137]|uniref:MIF4G like-domain-containing protein n=1 Tax=Vararia minispora EC-137 TaxID=1314806 RepID=A0ACB8QR74_9AGAM|nr:MIF4G like-domain-containing protein [Vararia minispora EC-137]
MNTKVCWEALYNAKGGGVQRRSGFRCVSPDKSLGGRDDVYREYEDPETRFRSTIIRIGEIDACEDIEQLLRSIQSSDSPNLAVLSEGLRIGLTEQPYKIPYYALLLRRLYDLPVKSEVSNQSGASLGRQVLDDLWKGFQAYLDKLAWREIRFCVHFFAHLTVAKVISPQSMLSLLQSFTTVLDEFGVSQGRAKRAARCAAEGLMRAGQSLKDYSPASVIEMITAIQTYSDLVASAKWLVHPMASLHTTELMLECAVSALKALDVNDFEQLGSVHPQPYTDAGAPDIDKYDLPSVLVPPDAMELDGLVPDASEDTPVKKEEWPEFYLSLFADDVTPSPKTPDGYSVRSDILDILDIFEINRKECARLLVDYPRWTRAGTFKPRPGGSDGNSDRSVPAEEGWQLESSIIEAVLGAQFLLPEPPHKPMYYSALITELCKISPQTFGPAVGKSIRKCYMYLADGLDVDIARRFAEWFSIHMSNFNFQWVWKEWVEDLNLCAHHPKRVFVRYALELEVRLSYFDRILKTLPPQFQDSAAGAVSDQAPGPEYGFDDPSVPYHEVAQSVLEQLRARSKPEDVINLLDTIRGQFTEDGVDDPDGLVRSIAVQSLLHTGSRSFSHFLNAIERYIVVLRSLATITSRSPGQDAKAGVLEAVAVFWRRNRQMISIVFDKLMQYQIVDPTDVVRWVFARAGRGLDWELLKGAVDKANGRVVVARKRIAALRKEEDETRARAMANDGAAMEVDAEVRPEPTAESPALATALKALSVLTQEQKATLSLVIEGFVNALHPSDTSAVVYEVVSTTAWGERTEWDEVRWTAWSTWSWFKHFSRAYAPYLRIYATTLTILSMAKLEGANDEAARALKKIWNVATGQE